MSGRIPKFAHPLDAQLAEANVFGWFGPMFQILGRHWLVAVAAGVATVIVEWLIEKLPWPTYLSLASWGMRAFHAAVTTAAAMIIAVMAYRLIAHREGLRYRIGEVNAAGDAVLRAVQVAIAWIVFGLLIQLALYLLVKMLIALFSAVGPQSANMLMAIVVVSYYGWPLIICLLAPIWFMLGVSSALSQAHAARSLEGPISVVLNSLRLVFSQKWRVIWPAFCFGAAISLLLYLELKFSFIPAALVTPSSLNLLIILSLAISLAMMFVIERIYAPDLGVEVADEVAPELTASPPPAAPGAPAPAVPTAPAAPVTPAAQPAHGTTVAPESVGPAAAELIENELRVNRATGLADVTQRGLAADPRFFAAHPDSTVALAKRLVQAQRPDLALRILQPYVKEQRNHRLHLTGSLLAAELLAHDESQLQSAARFLAQLKTYYPDEPMVDRLIRLADRAIAGGGTKPPST
ncbi:MAG: hypothetical protein ACRET4_17265 [Steroidobacteraceae bacterium]